MRWKLGVLLVIICVVSSLAQGAEKKVSMGGGYSRHGTDNVNGFFFSANYSSKLKKKWGYLISISGTMHDGKTPILYYDDIDLIWRRGYLYFVTGGVQLSAGLNYSLISWGKNSFIVGLTPLLRYQSTSNPNYSLINFYPTNYFSNSRFERNFSPGGSVFLAYTHDIKNDFFVSVTASLQYDTHEDALSMTGFSVGRRIRN